MKTKVYFNRIERHYLIIVAVIMCISAGNLFGSGDLYLCYSETIAPVGAQSEIATIIIENAYSDVRVDGVNISKKNMRSAPCKTRETYIIDLLPGRHNLSFLFSDNRFIGESWSASGRQEVAFVVEKGNFYRISYKAIQDGYAGLGGNQGMLMFSVEKYDDYEKKSHIIWRRNDAIANNMSWLPKNEKNFTVEVSDKSKGAIDILTMDYPERLTLKQAQELSPEGWRLPTATELQYLYENREFFGGFEGERYWTLTATASRNNVVAFDDGKMAKANEFDLHSVRYVRDKKTEE